MGVPEQEIVVSGTVKSVDGDTVVVDTVASQGETEIIKNAEAEVSSCSRVSRWEGHSDTPPRLRGCFPRDRS